MFDDHDPFIYRICSIKRPGVYYLKSSPERAFIRGGRLFESGRLLLRAIHVRVVSIYDGSWLFNTHSRQQWRRQGGCLWCSSTPFVPQTV